jgi:hypothetical protein
MDTRRPARIALFVRGLHGGGAERVVLHLAGLQLLVSLDATETLR